jgi:hypothetical protein
MLTHHASQIESVMAGPRWVREVLKHRENIGYKNTGMKLKLFPLFTEDQKTLADDTFVIGVVYLSHARGNKHGMTLFNLVPIQHGLFYMWSRSYILHRSPQ